MYNFRTSFILFFNEPTVIQPVKAVENYVKENQSYFIFAMQTKHFKMFKNQGKRNEGEQTVYN